MRSGERRLLLLPVPGGGGWRSWVVSWGLGEGYQAIISVAPPSDESGRSIWSDSPVPPGHVAGCDVLFRGSQRIINFTSVIHGTAGGLLEKFRGTGRPHIFILFFLFYFCPFFCRQRAEASGGLTYARASSSLPSSPSKKFILRLRPSMRLLTSPTRRFYPGLYTSRTEL